MSRPLDLAAHCREQADHALGAREYEAAQVWATLCLGHEVAGLREEAYAQGRSIRATLTDIWRTLASRP
jgi:hypothetical protein